MKKFPQILMGILILVSLIGLFPSGHVRAAGIIYYVKANASGSNNGTS